MNIYREALDVQDACDLRAIARLLVKAADLAADGTEASDPAVVLIVDKIESLVCLEDRTLAWYDCERKAAEQEAEGWTEVTA